MKNTLLKDLKYITDKNCQIFKKNQIQTVWELLTNFPSRFMNYTITPFHEILPNMNVNIAGIVQGNATIAHSSGKLSIMTFYMDVEGRRVRVTIYNRHFLRSKISYGTYVKAIGKMKEDMKSFVASDLIFDEISNSITPSFNIKGMSDEKVYEIKERVLEQFYDQIEDDLSDEIKKKYRLIDLREAIKYANIPLEESEIEQAVKRIKFDELFKFQLNIKYMLYMRKHFPEGRSMAVSQERITEFIATLPWKLTLDQMKAVGEIIYDLKSDFKMNRLLQGEVGSGKTVVAAICLYGVIEAGYQGALMVPTEVLAKQHYETFKQLFSNFSIRIGLLTATITTKERRIILEQLKNHEIDIVIGTHSLFQKEVEFKNIGLVITDEEHRFGVRQRVSIVGKGHLIDHLKMSATPIPRTLAISVLGDSDISVIKTLPGARKEVITKYLPYAQRKEAMEELDKQLLLGHQAYVICPMIDESEAMDLNNATQIYENMKKYFEGRFQVGLIHSKLKTYEKEEVMHKFSLNLVQILVSTSVIEVGVNVINATIILILDADRFGIAQLHQMRGRVRRSDHQAYCFLVSESKVETAVTRLKLVEHTSDGFILAEEDLLIRGPGDYFGEKQSGMIDFQMANLLSDKDLFLQADEAANEVMIKEYIFKEEYKQLYEMVNENYLSKKELLD